MAKKAGLNLNVFGALSGAFSSSSKKTTHQNKDGSSEVVEEGHNKGMCVPFRYGMALRLRAPCALVTAR
jgi:hypothetical protein